MPRPAALPLCLALATPLLAQSPAPRAVAFDVVSIKPHPQEQGAGRFNSSTADRPDGGVTMTNQPAAVFIARAYGIAPANMVGLPGWATSDRFDLSATASLERPTAEDRAVMMRAMLAQRFKLSARVEKREQAAYDLVLARKDGALGPGLQKIDTDCPRVIAERTAAAAANPPAQRPVPDRNAPPPPCTLRILGTVPAAPAGNDRRTSGDVAEGEATMTSLAQMLRVGAGRPVVDRTGLEGSYRVKMIFDMNFARRGPGVDAPPDAGPSVFSAVQEQLGLKLESSTTMVDTLIIDRLERPTEN